MNATNANLSGLARYEALNDLATQGAQYHLQFVQKEGLNCLCKTCRTAKAVQRV